MIPVIPLVIGAGLVVAFIMGTSKKTSSPETTPPLLPPGMDSIPTTGTSADSSTSPGWQNTPPLPGTPADAAAQSGTIPGSGSGVAVIPANALPPGGVIPINTYGPVGHVDDAFDVLVAQAILNGDTAALEALAKQAETRGLYDIARSIRDEIARLKGSAPIVTPVGPNVVVPPSSTVPSPTGRAILSLKAKSTGSDVKEWQRILGITQDGIFSSNTDAKTKLWQKAHGLVADGIVGPKTWATAYTMVPTLATAPKPSVTPAARPLLSLKAKSRGADVVEWQKVIGVTADGIFGPNTDTSTRAWQRTHGISADGIVGPNSWKAAYAQQPALAAPPGTTSIGIPTNRSDGFLTPGQSATAPPAGSPPESDARVAAGEITNYLNSLGGLSGRYKEDKSRVKSWQSRMKIAADGSYGRDSARAIMQLGLVPVAPYYWPKSGAAAAKAEFLSLVKTYSIADAPRAAQWSKLVSDTNRS